MADSPSAPRAVRFAASHSVALSPTAAAAAAAAATAAASPAPAALGAEAELGADVLASTLLQAPLRAAALAEAASATGDGAVTDFVPFVSLGRSVGGIERHRSATLEGLLTQQEASYATVYVRIESVTHGLAGVASIWVALFNAQAKEFVSDWYSFELHNSADASMVGKFYLRDVDANNLQQLRLIVRVYAVDKLHSQGDFVRNPAQIACLSLARLVPLAAPRGALAAAAAVASARSPSVLGDLGAIGAAGGVTVEAPLHVPRPGVEFGDLQLYFDDAAALRTRTDALGDGRSVSAALSLQTTPPPMSAVSVPLFASTRPAEPLEVRHDLFLLLLGGEFTADRKKAQKNAQLEIQVLDAADKVIPRALAVGQHRVDTYHTPCRYHSNTPVWREGMRVLVEPSDLPTSRLVVRMFHVSSRRAARRLFSIAYAPLTVATFSRFAQPAALTLCAPSGLAEPRSESVRLRFVLQSSEVPGSEQVANLIRWNMAAAALDVEAEALAAIEMCDTEHVKAMMPRVFDVFCRTIRELYEASHSRLRSGTITAGRRAIERLRAIQHAATKRAADVETVPVDGDDAVADGAAPAPRIGPGHDSDDSDDDDEPADLAQLTTSERYILETADAERRRFKPLRDRVVNSFFQLLELTQVEMIGKYLKALDDDTAGGLWLPMIKAMILLLQSPETRHCRTMLRAMPQAVRLIVLSRRIEVSVADISASIVHAPMEDECSLFLTEFLQFLSNVVSSQDRFAVAAQGIVLRQLASALREFRSYLGPLIATELIVDLLSVAPLSTSNMAHRTLALARALMADLILGADPLGLDAVKVALPHVRECVRRTAALSGEDALVAASAVADMIEAAEQHPTSPIEASSLLLDLLPAILPAALQPSAAAAAESRTAILTLMSSSAGDALEAYLSQLPTTFAVQLITALNLIIEDPPCSSRNQVAEVARDVSMRALHHFAPRIVDSRHVLLVEGYIRACLRAAETRAEALDFVSDVWPLLHSHPASLVPELVHRLLDMMKSAGAESARLFTRLFVTDRNAVHASSAEVFETAQEELVTNAVDLLEEEMLLCDDDAQRESLAQFVLELKELAALFTSLNQLRTSEAPFDDRVEQLFLITSKLRARDLTAPLQRSSRMLVDVLTNSGCFAEAGSVLCYTVEKMRWEQPKKVEALVEAAKLFDRGQCPERGVQVLSSVAAGLSRENNYSALADVLVSQADLARRVASVDSGIQYYRVVFYGAAAPAHLRNREYVYRTVGERVDAFSRAMRQRYPDAAIVLRSGEQPESVVNGQGLTIQITTVRIASPDSLTCTSSDMQFAAEALQSEPPASSSSNRVAIARAHARAKVFSFVRPVELAPSRVAKPGPDATSAEVARYETAAAIDDLQRMGLCLSFVETQSSFPSVARRLEVRKRHSITMSPVMYAAAQVLSRSCVLSAVYAACESGAPVSALEMVLSGTIAAAVNGGTARIIHAFLLPAAASTSGGGDGAADAAAAAAAVQAPAVPHDESELIELHSVLWEQVAILEASIDLHRRQMAETQRLLHVNLLEMLARMKDLLDRCQLEAVDTST